MTELKKLIEKEVQKNNLMLYGSTPDEMTSSQNDFRRSLLRVAKAVAAVARIEKEVDICYCWANQGHKRCCRSENKIITDIEERLKSFGI